MRYDFGTMLTNGQMARELGVDARTVRSWAIQGHIPSYVNPANNYRYYVKTEVINALGLAKVLSSTVDETKNRA